MVSNQGSSAYKLQLLIKVHQAPKNIIFFSIFAMASKKVVVGQTAPKAPSSLARNALFHKLKNGLFQEAFELCLITGAHVCIIVFGPDGKPYTFGFPSVEMVVNRFLKLSPPSNANLYPDWESVSNLIQRYYDLLEGVDAEEIRDEKWAQEMEELWGEDLLFLLGANQQNSDQLAHNKEMLKNFMDKVANQLEELEVRISKGLVDSDAAKAGTSGS